MAVHLASDFYESMGINDVQGDERSFAGAWRSSAAPPTFDVESDYSAIQIAGTPRIPANISR